MRQPIVFLSYSRKDERYKDKLITQISVLQLANKFDLWSDDRIRAGTEWRTQIDHAMGRATVAILLITANYLTSDFILRVEVPELLQRHKEDGLSVLPVIARECPWEEVPWLTRLNVLPDGGRPVWRSGGRYAEKELANIARAVASLTKSSREGTGRRTEPSRATAPVSSKMMGTARDSIEEAILSIDGELDNLKSASEPINLGMIYRIIRLAINYGSPIYNNGAIRGCAEIYTHTAKALVSLIEESTYGDTVRIMNSESSGSAKTMAALDSETMKRDAGVEVAYSELKPACAYADLTDENADKVAWSIRHRFDQLAFVADALNSIDEQIAIANYADDKAVVAVRKALHLAIFQAGRIYEVGQRRNKRWILGCATVYLHTAQRVLSLLPSITRAGDKPASELSKVLEAKLGRVMFVGLFVTPANAYELSWGIRHAFDRALEIDASSKHPMIRARDFV